MGPRRPRTDEDRTSPLLPHYAYETDALPRHGLDEALRLASVANRTARRVDAGGHGRVGHDASTPDCGKQIVPAHQTLAVSNQVLKEIEHLGLKSHGVAAVGQLATVRVKSIVIKKITHSRFRWEAQGSLFMVARSWVAKKQAGDKEKEALLKAQPQLSRYLLTTDR